MIFSSYFAFISLPLLHLALADVSCGGGSSAKICAECPSGEAGCGDTDCTWHPMTSLCRDSFSDDVRTASVHLWYDAPAAVARPAWWFQRVVPTASAQSTYFSTSAQRFGYGGIQEVNSSTGRVIFSLWDQGDCNQDVDPNCDDKDKAKTVACGTGVRCNGFNGEGTGAKSSYDRAPFSLNEAYYFVTQAKFLGNKRMEYTGYFYENGLWRLLSRIQVATNSNEQWWIDGMSSFVEQFAARETTNDRGALFGPSYMADEDATDFHQIKTAKFSHGTLENHERVNAWQAGEDWQHAVGIETGGNVVPVAKRGDVFTYPDYVPYGELTSFRKKINCLNLAQNKDEIESCLNTTPTDVWCGGHGAPSCGKCPYNSNGDYMGPAWCNGECAWNNADAKCAAKPPPAPVWCGGHGAPSCEKCPYDSNGNYMGPAWCNGECAWNNTDAKCAGKLSLRKLRLRKHA